MAVEPLNYVVLVAPFFCCGLSLILFGSTEQNDDSKWSICRLGGDLIQ
jgi:hypothetical protein